MNLPRRRLLLLAAVMSLALAGMLASSASAASSRELINGFDNEYHCTSENDATHGTCMFFNAMIPWIRGGAPDPTKPVLVLDRDGTTDPDCASSCNEAANPAVVLELDNSLDLAFGVGVLNKQVVDPRSPEFAALPLDTAHYSAIVVASDVTCGGCDLNNNVAQPDSDALLARRNDIVNFYRNGGGVMAFSGGGINPAGPATRGGSGTLARCDHYYEFLPFPATCDAGGGSITATPAGQAIGLQDTFYEFAHNNFQPPDPGSPLQVGATSVPGSDAAARGTTVPTVPETLFTDIPAQPTIASVASAAACTGSFQASDPGGSGTKAIHYKANGGAETVVATDASGKAAATFPQGTTSVEYWAEDAAGNQESPHHTLAVTGCAKPAAPTIGVAGVRRACTSSSTIHVRISVTAPGTVKTVKVSLDGKTIKTTTKSRFTLRINMKKLKAGRHRLRTVVTDQAGNTKTSTRTIARCAVAKPKSKASPRFTG
jgi:Big-like domain-containing protein